MKNLELYREICESFNNEMDGGDIEFADNVEVNGILYTYEEVEKLKTIDEGKYQYGGSIYAIGVSKEDGYSIVEPLFYVRQGFSKSGSYFSDYQYEYEELEIVERKEELKLVVSWESI